MSGRALPASSLRLAPMGRATEQTPVQSTSSAAPLHQPQYILSATQPQTYADQEAAFIELIGLRNWV